MWTSKNMKKTSNKSKKSPLGRNRDHQNGVTFFSGLLLTFRLLPSKIPRACIHMMSDSRTFKTKRSKMFLSPWLVDASCNPFKTLINYLPLGDFFQGTRQTCDIQLSFQCSEGKLLRTRKTKGKRKASEHLGQTCLSKFHVVLTSEFCKVAVIYANDTHSTN